MNVSDTIKNKLTILGATITGAEEKMRAAGACVTTTYGDLKWERYGGKFRICQGGKPLIENPIEDRVKGFRQLDLLVKAVFAKANEILAGIEDEENSDD